MKHEIHSDGVTVWVNSLNGLIGRFGRQGIDIHRVLRQQSSSGECLYCTHAKTVASDWPIFVAKMEELHGVHVPENHKPKRFREQLTGA